MTRKPPYLQAHRQDYGPGVLYRVLAGQFVIRRDYSKALKIQHLIKEEHARVLQEVAHACEEVSPHRGRRPTLTY